MRAMANRLSFQSALVGRETVAVGTTELRFTKPAAWSYRAGQFVHITVQDPPETDAGGTTRGFSISSAPREDVIAIAIRTRQRDTAFEQALQGAPAGDGGPDGRPVREPSSCTTPIVRRSSSRAASG